MTRKQGRKSYSVEFKSKVLKKYLQDGQQVSQICEEHKLAPSLFYKWLKDLFTNINSALDIPSKTKHKSDKVQQELKAHQSTINQKNAIIAELTHELVNLKKNLGLIR